MPQGTKIATCCYCGTRAALVLRGETRHELSCASCGAPLHDLKMMPVARPSDTPSRQARLSAGLKTPRKSSRSAPPTAHSGARPDKIRKRKKRKSPKRRIAWLLDEAFDAIEDIFD